MYDRLKITNPISGHDIALLLQVVAVVTEGHIFPATTDTYDLGDGAGTGVVWRATYSYNGLYP